MRTIAITGGIGSGKSVVTDYLISRGFTVIDADKMSREMTSPGGKAMPYILEHFGASYINEDGGLNRAAMRDLVFRDRDAKKLLEKGTTDVVIADIARIRKEAEESGTIALFFDIPLLFETGRQKEFDYVWTVTADYEKRRERVMKRDGIDPAVIDLIMDSQADEDLKIANSDVVFYNNSTIEDLKAAVEEALDFCNL